MLKFDENKKVESVRGALALRPAIEAVADGLRQLQLEYAVHGQGKNIEKQRKRCQHPHRLQARLKIELGAEHPHQRAKQCKAGGHGQDVGQ